MLIAIARRMAALAAMALILAIPAGAQDQADEQTFGDWRINCDPAGEGIEQCALVQFVVAEEDDGIWLRAYFFRPPESVETLLLSVLVPLDVILTRRLGLRIDDRERVQFDFIRCSHEGCLVSIPIDDPLLATFRSGNEALFDFYFEDDEGIGVPVSLAGLTAGLDALP